MTDNFFEKLKRVNKRSNLIIYGYLRECESKIFGGKQDKNPFYNFPEIMKTICLIYYHITDQWDPQYIAPNHKLSHDGLRISNDTVTSRFESSFGQQIAHSPGKYIWKFKLLQVPKLDYNAYWTVILGIWKINSCESPVTDDYWTGCAKDKGNWAYGYAYDVTAGTLVNDNGQNACTGGEYGTNCKGGDIIEMCLDFDTSTLRFIINGEDMGPTPHQIQDTEYRLALCTFHKGSIIEMLP